MPFSIDPEVGAAMATLFAGAGEMTPPPRGDVEGRRQGVDALMGLVSGLIPTPDDVSTTDYETTADDGARILLRWYTKDGVSPGSAVLYAHGGGMIMCTVADYDAFVSRYVSETGVPFLSVEYRYAPEHMAPVPVTDCYAGLQWLADHASELGVDPDRIAIMGDSGGGGVVASLAIYARDQHGPAVRKQVLVYPMLDDRTTEPDPEILPFLAWTYDDNATGWGALLGDAVGGPDVSPYAAPARLQDFTNLPPAYIEVGELDIFRDECLAYAQRLLSHGVSTEFHLHPGAPHGAEGPAVNSDLARRIMADRYRVITSI